MSIVSGPYVRLNRELKIRSNVMKFGRDLNSMIMFYYLL